MDDQTQSRIDEILSRPAVVKKNFWDNRTFRDIMEMVNKTDPPITPAQREKLYDKLCKEMMVKMAKKVIGDRKFVGIEPWDLVSKMFIELQKFDLSRATSAYSYFYTVALREAYSLSTLASKQIVPIFLNYKEEYPLSRYEKDRGIIEKDGYIVIQTTKTGKDTVKVWYQPINGVLDIHMLYEMDFDEDDSEYFSIPDADPFTQQYNRWDTNPDLESYAGQGFSTNDAGVLSYGHNYDYLVGDRDDTSLNLVRDAIEEVANNVELSLKSYGFFYWLNRQRDILRTENLLWDAFCTETKITIKRHERALILFVLQKAIANLQAGA
jgi:hypothetical protein